MPHLNAIRRTRSRSEEHTSELQSRQYLVCRLLLEKKPEPWSSDPDGLASRPPSCYRARALARARPMAVGVQARAQRPSSPSPEPSALFFFLMIRRPPRSPLFPYTPPFRSPAEPRALPRRRPPPGARRARRGARRRDRKSTRLNSSHANISYAVFCLKKK